jgi:hypothetical protein
MSRRRRNLGGGGVQHPKNPFHYLRHSDRGGQERAQAFCMLSRSAGPTNRTRIPGRFSLAMRPRAMPLGLPGAKSRQVTRSSSRSALSKSSNAVIGSARANESCPCARSAEAVLSANPGSFNTTTTRAGNAARETDFDKFVEKAPEKQAYRCGGAQ